MHLITSKNKMLLKRVSENEVLSQVLKIAIPVSLQSLVTSSFSLVDQMMTGSLGTNAIAAIAFANRVSLVFTMLIGAIASSASIMIAQYYGKKDMHGLSKSFFINIYYSLIVTVVFMIAVLFFPELIISFFTTDTAVIPIAVDYLRIIGISFLPLMLINILSPVFRNMGYNKHLLYISLSSLSVNAVLNYIFIFGKLGMPAMGVHGAAIATLISRIVETLGAIAIYIYI